MIAVLLVLKNLRISWISEFLSTTKSNDLMSDFFRRQASRTYIKYVLEACPLKKSDTISLDFVVDRFSWNSLKLIIRRSLDHARSISVLNYPVTCFIFYGIYRSICRRRDWARASAGSQVVPNSTSPVYAGTCLPLPVTSPPARFTASAAMLSRTY